MDEDVADGLLPDVRPVDMAVLLTDSAESSMGTALDRLLTSNADVFNGFNSIA
jgi:hypothetical protein